MGLKLYIIIYFALMLIYYFLANNFQPKLSSVSDRIYNIVFSNKARNLIAFVLIFSAFSLVGMKVYYAYSRGNSIGSEIISPTFLTDAGRLALSKLSNIDPNDVLFCHLRDNCPSPTDDANSQYFFLNHDVYEHFRSKGLNKEVSWVKNNDLSLFGDALFRGLFVHHYSVISEPVRQIESGDYSAIFTSQYGLSSLIPMIFLKGSSFTLYNVASFIILPIIFLYFLHLSKSENEFAINSFIYGGIFLAFSLIINEGAIVISPGFSIYRIIPMSILISSFIYRDKFSKLGYLSIIFAWSMLSDVQFNVLFLIMVSSFLFIKYISNNFMIEEIIKNKLINTVIIMISVSLFQYILYNLTSNAFTPPLFGSIEPGEFHWTYVCYASVFPLLVMFVKFIRKDLELSDEELFSFVAYGFMATYPLSFIKSPEHYADFIIMASPAIFILLRRFFSYGSWWGLISICAFILVPVHYGFFNLPSKINYHESDLFNYRDLGRNIKFNSVNDIKNIYRQYKLLQSSVGANDKNTYLISKDKIYFEAMTGHNINPVSYDAYVNVKFATFSKIENDIKKNGIDYIALYSPSYSSSFMKFLKYSGVAFTNPLEEKSYIGILNYVKYIREKFPMKEVGCSDRYCFYKVDR